MLAAALLVAQPTIALAASPVVDEWVQRVSSHYLRVRLSAQYDYGQMALAPADSVAALLVELNNSQSVVREYAVAALGELEAPPDVVVPALLKALRDPIPVVQSQAALALAKVGEPAGKAIVAELLAAEGLANPKEKAIRWEDYAVASLRLMQERSAPAIADAMVSLGRFAEACPVRAVEENDRDNSEQELDGRETRPGYVGDALKFHVLASVAKEMNPAGARIMAMRLVDAADGSAEPIRGRLNHLAVAILADAEDSTFVDSDERRNRRLARALVDRRCGEEMPYQAQQGTLTIALIEELIERGSLDEAQALIRTARPAGAAMEPWATKIEQFLVDGRDEVRTGAMEWIASHPNDEIPLPEAHLLKLAASPEIGTASAAANYLMNLGNRSEEIIRAYQGLLQRPDLEESQRSDIIQTLAVLQLEMPEVEPIIAGLAMSEAGTSDEDGSCSAVDALSEVEGLSEGSRKVLLEAVRNGVCVPAAASGLLNAGLSVKQIIARAAVPAGEAGETVRTDIQLASENHNTSYEDEEFEVDSDEGSGFSEAELLSRAKREGWLNLRDRPVEVVPGNTPDDFGLNRIRSLYEPIAILESFAGDETDRSSPLFSVLADLKIFEMVQDQVGDAAIVRLTLAYPAYQNPPPPPPPPPPEPERNGEPVRLLPKWPWSWPPPKYSSWNTLDIAGLTSRATVGGVFARLQRALNQAGYYENRLYGIPQGVAVVTHVEETTPDGIPLKGDRRWQLQAPSLFSSQYWVETIAGIRTHHRQFVFFLTKNQNISGGTTTLPLEQARNPKVDGSRELPPEIATIPWNGFYLHAVVYRFNKINSKVTPVAPDIFARDQMRRAGIFIKQTGGQ